MSFARYTLRRVLSTAVLAMLLSLGCFLILDFAPGSFYDEMRVDPQVSPAAVDALRAAHGLSKPALHRFAEWTGSLLHGDLGMSFASNRPVTELLLPRLRNTLLLTIPALALGWAAGLLTGIWAAARSGAWLDRAATLFSSAFNLIPELVLGSVALLLAVRSGVFPVGGMFSPQSTGGWTATSALDLARHITLPLLVLATMAFPAVFAHTRAAVADALDAPFVQSARAHGVPRRVLLVHHILPVAANALLSLGGLSFGTLLSASLVIEVLFAWPGIGPLFLDAVSARDPYVILAGVLCFACMLISGNLLADLALHYRDARLRTA
jgi:peptide/nickel transport system permease protein